MDNQERKAVAKKKEAVDKLAEKISASNAIILADYRGVTVEEDTELRISLRNAGLEYKVYKNSLLKFAAKKSGLEALEPFFVGPTAVTFCNDDIVEPAKVLTEGAKKFGNFELKVAFMEGTIIDAVRIKDIAALPPKPVLISKVLGGFNAPIAGLVNALTSVLRSFPATLNAIAQQKAE